MVRRMRDLQSNNADAFSRRGAGPEDIEEVCETLRTLERTWADTIHYGAE